MGLPLSQPNTVRMSSFPVMPKVQNLQPTASGDLLSTAKETWRSKTQPKVGNHSLVTSTALHLQDNQ